MPDALLHDPQQDQPDRVDASAWLSWTPSTDHVVCSHAAAACLWLDEYASLEHHTELMRLFDRQNQNRLAIGLEEVVTSGAPQAVEILRQTPEGPRVILFRIELDESADEKRVLAVLEDITLHYEGKRRLAERARFQTFLNLIRQDTAFFEAVPLGMLMVQGGFISQINAKLCEILETPCANLIGEPISRILSSKQSYDTYMEAIWGGEIEAFQSDVETEFENEHGKLFWLKVSITRISQVGQEQACLCIIEDITDRKKLEQDVWDGLVATIAAKEAADHASRAKGEFLAMISHEIRTPLSAVMGMQKLALRDPQLSEKTRKHLTMAQANADFLLDLLNDVLDFSKIEADKLVLENVDFPLRRIISDSVGPLAERAEAKGISLEVSIDDAVPNTLAGDPARLKQILFNLIGNGIKFTDQGGVSLCVVPKEITSETCIVSFAVQDTGIGIAAEAQAKLFQKFAQADTSTTRRFGGTGLGLAICKQLVELMGGEIGLTSELGKGSCFTFLIPFKIGSAPALPLAVSLQPHTHQLRILCAEDFIPSQIIIQGLIEEMGHRITFVDNGRKALEALTLHQYDLILMDGRMPEMDGATAIRLIRAAGDGKFHIPDPGIRIIMLTANADTESRNFYLSCGADDFLVKPIDEAALHQSLERAIEVLLAANVALLPRFQNAPKALEAIFGLAPPPEDPGADDPPIERVEDDESRRVALRIRLQEAFREDLTKRVPELEQAASARDFRTLANLFHSLKGSAGYIWPDSDLRCLSEALEKSADQQDWGAIEQGLPKLRMMLDDVMRGMDA